MSASSPVAGSRSNASRTASVSCSRRSEELSRCTRCAKARARASIHGLLIISSDCVGVVVELRCAVLAKASGRSNTSSKRVMRIAQDFRVDRAARFAGIDARAAGAVVEFASRGEDRVADLLRVEAAGIGAPEQAVLRDLSPVATFASAGVADCCQVALSRMSRCSFLNDQPLSTNCRVSQSSSSGCEGGWPSLPKSDAVATRPLPEVILPHAIDDHPRGQRVLGIREPAGERGAAPSGVFVRPRPPPAAASSSVRKPGAMSPS